MEHASAGLGDRVWTQLVARKSWTRGTAFNSLQDSSQETPGLTDGLEFVRVIPTDWPAACPDRHREAIHHLSSCLSVLSLSCPKEDQYTGVTQQLLILQLLLLTTCKISIHPSQRRMKKKILRSSPTRTLPCAIHPNPHNTQTLYKASKA